MFRLFTDLLPGIYSKYNFNHSLDLYLLPIVFITFSFPAHALELEKEPIQPIDNKIQINHEKATLGKKLFHDPILSADNSTACVTCHNLKGNGADKNKKLSTKVHGTLTYRNTPTVFNTVFNSRQFWDGSVRSLKEQADKALQDDMLGDTEWEDIAKKLKNSPDYQNLFKKSYGSINRHYAVDAIAEFVKTLITIDAPFDLYLKGNKNAITEQQKHGYELFKSYGCSSCHQGKNVGGNMMEKMGVMEGMNTWKNKNGDLGLYNITGRESDKYVFKVPSLRLVTVTAPYFHDGSIDTLEETIDIMIRYQLGRPIPEKDRSDIVEFLHSLTGMYQSNLTDGGKQ